MITYTVYDQNGEAIAFTPDQSGNLLKVECPNDNELFFGPEEVKELYDLFFDFHMKLKQDDTHDVTPPVKAS